MGLLKRRIQAEDVIINIGAEARVPAPPAGHEWKEVIHNRKVGWLAGWKDSINTKDWKYVQLGATSSLKADSDLRKFERARELKAHIGAIRADYTRNMASRSTLEAQLAVTTYLVDKLALRAGGEKDDDLADTVGVCTLRARRGTRQRGTGAGLTLSRPAAQVGHVQRVPPSTLKFDFLVRSKAIWRL